MVYRILAIALPIIAGPLAVYLLRPLFEMFIRQGTNFFTDMNPGHYLTEGLSHTLALVNVLIFVAAWVAAFALHVTGQLPDWVPVVVLVVGLLLAMLATVRMVRGHLGVPGSAGVLTGLVVFTGGNLPVFVLIPAALAVWWRVGA